MKITKNKQQHGSGFHCCDCGSHQPKFDELQHAQYCVEIRREQQWTTCLFCNPHLGDRPLGHLVTNLNDLATLCYDIAEANGWHDTPREFGTVLMLVVTEVAEAMEAWRNGDDDSVVSKEFITDDGKPEGVPSEMADILIRVLHICAIYGIDIREAMKQKMAYNAGRSYRHGNKLA